MINEKIPEGFKCECGEFHKFGAWVANANRELFHTCIECGYEHIVLNYTVSLVDDDGNVITEDGPTATPYLDTK